MSSMMSSVVNASLDESYSIVENWYGPALRPTLSELSVEQLIFSATHEGYSAWEIALHCAYWKWYVRARMTKEEDSFPYAPENFPRIDPSKQGESDWKQALAYLDDQHERLKAAVAPLSDAELVAPWKSESGGDADGTVARMVQGIAFHDAYHAAQIRNMGVPGLKEEKR